MFSQLDDALLEDILSRMYHWDQVALCCTCRELCARIVPKLVAQEPIYLGERLRNCAPNEARRASFARYIEWAKRAKVFYSGAFEAEMMDSDDRIERADGLNRQCLILAILTRPIKSLYLSARDIWDDRTARFLVHMNLDLYSLRTTGRCNLARIEDLLDGHYDLRVILTVNTELKTHFERYASAQFVHDLPNKYIKVEFARDVIFAHWSLDRICENLIGYGEMFLMYKYYGYLSRRFGVGVALTSRFIPTILRQMSNSKFGCGYYPHMMHLFRLRKKGDMDGESWQLLCDAIRARIVADDENIDNLAYHMAEADAEGLRQNWPEMYERIYILRDSRMIVAIARNEFIRKERLSSRIERNIVNLRIILEMLRDDDDNKYRLMDYYWIARELSREFGREMMSECEPIWCKFMPHVVRYWRAVVA